jgi:hypothetical protein
MRRRGALEGVLGPTRTFCRVARANQRASSSSSSHANESSRDSPANERLRNNDDRYVSHTSDRRGKHSASQSSAGESRKNFRSGEEGR